MPSGVFLSLPCCAADPVTNSNALQLADRADHNQRGAFLSARYQTIQTATAAAAEPDSRR